MTIFVGMFKNRKREVAIHLLAVATFLLLPVLFAPGPVDLHGFVQNPHIKRDFLSSAIMLLFFYANYFVFIPRFYFRKKYLPFLLFALLFLASIALLPALLFPFERGRPGPPPPAWGGGLGFVLFEMGHQFFLFAATILLSLTIKINGRWRRTEKEKLRAELSYLKAQINPHFLFNTLNSIYALSIEKSDKTPEAVVKLSGMMRYVLSESHKDHVPLGKEIDYIGDYVELQKIRLGHTVKLSYSFSGQPSGKEIAPLVLIPFVENAFKHGVNAEEISDIVIHIQVDEKSMTLEVINNKVRSVADAAEKSGLGIENTRNRLKLLYPDTHELTIRDADKVFSVVLKIYFA